MFKGSFLILFLLLINLSYAQNSWLQKNDFGGVARRSAIGFSIGNKGYIGTGTDGNYYFYDFWEFDPLTNSWTQKANFGGDPRCAATCFSIGTKGYVGFGYIIGFLTPNFWEYNAITNTWSQIANLGGILKWWASSFSIGNYGYVGTGYENLNWYDDFWQYDPTINAWTQKANFGGTPRGQAVGFSINGKGYIGTGRSSLTNILNDFWEYDPVSNNWTQKANYGGDYVYRAASFSLNGKGYVGTGWDSTGINRSDFWEYDPVSDTWTQKLDFPDVRVETVAFSIGAKGFMGTGWNGLYTKDFWEYTPSTNPIPPTPKFLSSDTVFCQYQCVNFYDISNNNPTNWQWKFAGGTPDTSTLQNPVGICYAIPGKYEVRLIVSNAFGSDSIIIPDFIVNNGISPNIITTDSVICTNDSVTLNSNSSGQNFQWYLNGNLIAGATNNPYFATIGGNYSFLAIDSTGCQTFSDTIQLDLDTLLLDYPILISISNCISAQLCAAVDTSLSFLWNTTEITPCININSAGIYSVTVTDSYGCTGFSDTLISFPAPNYYSITTPLSCDSTVLCAYSGYNKYLWSTGDTVPCITVFNSDTFTVTLTDSNFCTLVGTISSNISTLNSLLIQSFDTLNAFPNNPLLTYSWLLNGNNYPVCNPNPSCIISLNGNYQVILSDTNGCIDTSSIITILNLGIINNKSPEDTRIIPNPSNGNFLLTIKSLIGEEIDLKMFNISGQNVFVGKWISESNVAQIPVKLISLCNGIYDCQIKVGTKNYREKIAIIK